MVNKQLDEYLVQQIISRLILPFDRWPAFKYGIISKDGKVLKQKNQLKTREEQESWGYLDILCCNLRKILSDYPTTKMRLAQLNMIQNAPLPTVIGQPPTIPLSTLAGSFFLLKEDAPANAMGAGAIAGGGIGPQGDPPVRRGTILTKILRRKAKIRVGNS